MTGTLSATEYSECRQCPRPSETVALGRGDDPGNCERGSA